MGALGGGNGGPGGWAGGNAGGGSSQSSSGGGAGSGGGSSNGSSTKGNSPGYQDSSHGVESAPASAPASTQSLADALGVGQQTQGDGSATPNAHDTAQTMSSMFNMSDKSISRGLSELGYDQGERAGVVGPWDSLSVGPWSEALSNIGETALSITNPIAGLVLQLGDIGQKAYSRGLDSIKGSVPSLVGLGVRSLVGPLAGAVANAGTSLAMGDTMGAGKTVAGVASSAVNGLLGGNPLTGLALHKGSQYAVGLLAQNASNAAPSSGAEGGNHSIGGQSGHSNFAEGSLSKALLEGAGNTGNTGNTGRTGLNNAIAPKQVISPIQTAMANYSQFS